MFENGITGDDCSMGGIVFLSVLEFIDILFSIHGGMTKYRDISLRGFLSGSIKFCFIVLPIHFSRWVTTIYWRHYFVPDILIIAARLKSAASYKGFSGGHFYIVVCISPRFRPYAANDELDASNRLADENHLRFYLKQQALAQV